MGIDQMTIGQVRELLALLSNSTQVAPTNPFIGRYVICRCMGAGVHAGTLVSQTNNQALLKNARRLWSWRAKDGIALSGLAVHGLAGGKIDTRVEDILLFDVVEIIPCSKKAEETINDA